MGLIKPRYDGDELVSVWSLFRWTIIVFVIAMAGMSLFIELVIPV